MEMFVSAALGDLVSRSISFVISKCYRQPVGVQENLQRLHLLLLRIQATVDEAEGRHITNQAMLQQLQMLRGGMYRGYYMLDTFQYHILQERVNDQVSDRLFALSRLNSAKRLRFSATKTNIVFEEEEIKELQKMLDSLESIIASMKECVVFLKWYPRMCREPYGKYLLLDKCMFGRQAELERVINFLLQAEPPGAESLGVLPITGPARVGKSTLVEHVCHDERVRNHFCSIICCSGSVLGNENLTSLENGVIKHRSHASHGRSLVVIEFTGDVDLDEGSWRRLYSSGSHLPHESKIIVTSRSERILNFGTTQGVKLKFLPREAYWYFFKLTAFGSTNPEEHPLLVSIAMEIAMKLYESFISANVVGGLLRTNFCTQFWHKILKILTYHVENHLFLYGEHPVSLLRRNRPVHLWRLSKDSKSFVVYNCYETYSAQNETPNVILHEVQTGNAKPRGKFEALLWRSHIPPCYSYFVSCEIQTPKDMAIKKKHSKQRGI